MDAVNPLTRVCALLNQHAAQYLVVGAQAGILHGHIRTTEDVDILIPEDEANHARVIAALSELEDHAAAELTPQDLIENIVVKIADEVEVDLSTRAWKVSFADAIPTALKISIDGIEIPYLDLSTLIASKDTCRDQDQVDVQILREIARRQPKPK
ncbi:MAG: nucleotidyltransferase [Chthoniobacter sp.]